MDDDFFVTTKDILISSGSYRINERAIINMDWMGEIKKEIDAFYSRYKIEGDKLDLIESLFFIATSTQYNTMERNNLIHDLVGIFKMDDSLSFIIYLVSLIEIKLEYSISTMYKSTSTILFCSSDDLVFYIDDVLVLDKIHCNIDRSSFYATIANLRRI